MTSALVHPLVPRPLVVDLDGSLIRTDSLHEALVVLLFRDPLRLPGVMMALWSGRAAFKQRATRAANLDCGALPFDDAVLALIADRRAAGGAVHLVTAADQAIAAGVARSVPVFDSATGSDGVRNLAAAAKAEYLGGRFPEGFDYIGDCAADLPVWRRAGAATVAGGGAGIARRLRREGLETTALPCRKARTRDWIKALRLHQWSKNLLLCAPLLLAQDYRDPALVLRVLLAWILFGMAASATYLINDLSDLAVDRRHPTKRFRALAAGRIPIRTGGPLALALLVAGVSGACLLHGGLGLALIAYVALTLAYSFRLKRAPLIDVATIAALFAIRIVAGMLLIDRPVSMWLVTFTTMLFLSLALAKRTAELVQARAQGRPVAGRGYHAGDEPLTLTLGIAAGMTSVLVMVLYMSVDAMPTGLYRHTGPLFLIPAVLGLWILRIWLLAHRGTLNDDPVVFAIRDPGSWAHAGAVVALWMLAVGMGR
jgi:4-hydroxybenzoate polyprenyltransferase